MGIDQQPYDKAVYQESMSQLKQRRSLPTKELLQGDNKQDGNDDQKSLSKLKYR